MNKLVNYLLKTPRYKFILFSLGSIIFWTILSVLVMHYLGVKNIHSATMHAKSNLFKFLSGVLFAPLFETFIFQYLIIEFVYYIFKKNLLSILVSGFIFGFTHYFNNHSIIYSTVAVIAGFVFASIYVLAKKRKDVYPFLMVWMSHMFINTVGFIPLILCYFKLL